ncbi:MAG: YqgE/AlgH family protein [Proteobacteria bacterium]|nr:YqgE/AlgH family protein [Pseudomonadota bacterium]
MPETSAAKPLPMHGRACAGRLVAAFFAALIAVLGVPPAPPGLAAPTEGTWDDSLAGRLLVATEKMGDPRFQKTVIYMIEHNRDGAMGLVINVPMGAVPAAKLFNRLGLDGDGLEGEIEVYFGGPVDPERGFLLHSADVLLEGSVRVDERVALTARPEMLLAIVRGDGPAQSVFTLGYTGWGPGQLESELARDDWFVIPADMSLVFAPDPTKSWERAAARRGFDL